MQTQRRYKVLSSAGFDKIIKAKECKQGEEFICQFVGTKVQEKDKGKLRKGEDGQFTTYIFKLLEDMVHNGVPLKAGAMLNFNGTFFEDTLPWLEERKTATLAVIFEGVKDLDNGQTFNMWNVLEIADVEAYSGGVPDESEPDLELSLDDDEEAGLESLA